MRSRIYNIYMHIIIISIPSDLDLNSPPFQIPNVVHLRGSSAPANGSDNGGSSGANSGEYVGVAEPDVRSTVL